MTDDSKTIKLVECKIEGDAGVYYTFECPHCKAAGLDSSILIAKTELNCRIMIHGTMKGDGSPVAPHSSKAVCEALLAGESIWGCGKSLQITPEDHVVARGYES